MVELLNQPWFYFACAAGIGFVWLIIEPNNDDGE